MSLVLWFAMSSASASPSAVISVTWFQSVAALDVVFFSSPGSVLGGYSSLMELIFSKRSTWNVVSKDSYLCSEDDMKEAGIGGLRMLPRLNVSV